MRAKEFLLEYNLEVTARQTSDKILDALKNDTGFLPENMNRIRQWLRLGTPLELTSEDLKKKIIADIEHKDRTTGNLYTAWMARMYSRGGVKYEDLNRFDLVTKYHIAKHRNLVKPEHKDINKFKTYKDFENVVIGEYDSFEVLDDPDSMEEKPQAKKVFDNEEVLIVVPENEAAACKYGKGTRWCTAATSGKNYFDEYNKEGNLYIVIPKQPDYPGEKYQLHFESESFMDEKDEPIESLMGFLEGRFLTDEVDKFFKKYTKPKKIKQPGRVEYKEYGELHREDGPAIIWDTGSEEWFRYGRRHREDGPAVTIADGPTSWWINGELHREDGPAITALGRTEWWIRGKRYSEEEFNEKMSKTLKESTEPAPIDEIISNKLNLQSFIVSERGDTLTLHSIIVGKQNQGKGLGTKALQMLTDYADKNQKRIILTPAVKDKTHGTTSRSRLVKFYKQFGFKESKGKNIDYAIGAGKMYREPNALNEGGWASTATQGTVITPSVVKATLKIMEQFVNDFNNWLSARNLPSIKMGRPAGSTAYHNIDDEDKIYGDIDLQMIAPEVEEGKSPSQFSGFWNKLADEFIEETNPSYLHPTENTTGHPILKVGKDSYVQIDFMWHPDRLSKWGAARVTPERGIKGLLTGNMFSVFGEIMNMSVQHAGVQVKLSNDEIVPFNKRKDTELVTVTDEPETYILDTFKWLANRQGIQNPKIDERLKNYSGIDIDNVKIANLVQGVKGFASSLEMNNMFGKGDLSDITNYEDFMDKFITRYVDKAKTDISGGKRSKAETPDAMARAEADIKKIQDGLALVLQMFEVE